VPSPSVDALAENVEAVKTALRRLVPGADLSRCYGRACVKVDIEPTATGFANLNIAFAEPVPNCFWVFPGKMTEAPFAADAVVRALTPRLVARYPAMAVGSPRREPIADIAIAPRPIDTY
jgi:hypothetical protein